ALSRIAGHFICLRASRINQQIVRGRRSIGSANRPSATQCASNSQTSQCVERVQKYLRSETQDITKTQPRSVAAQQPPGLQHIAPTRAMLVIQRKRIAATKQIANKSARRIKDRESRINHSTPSTARLLMACRSAPCQPRISS